jgi:hypothetical protein
MISSFELFLESAKQLGLVKISKNYWIGQEGVYTKTGTVFVKVEPIKKGREWVWPVNVNGVNRILRKSDLENLYNESSKKALEKIESMPLPEGAIILKEYPHLAKWFDEKNNLTVLQKVDNLWKRVNFLKSTNAEYLMIGGNRINKLALDNLSNSLDPLTFIPAGFTLLEDKEYCYRNLNDNITVLSCKTGYWKAISPVIINSIKGWMLNQKWFTERRFKENSLPEGAIIFDNEWAALYNSISDELLVYSNKTGVWKELKPQIMAGKKHWSINSKPTSEDIIKAKIGITPKTVLPKGAIQLDDLPYWVVQTTNSDTGEMNIEILSTKTINPRLLKKRPDNTWQFNGRIYTKNDILNWISLINPEMN